jgi:hypothetical protein
MKDEIIVKWRCTAPRQGKAQGHFNRVISCSDDAIMNYEDGWLCDCGRWTKGDDVYHKPLKMGIRKIVDCRRLREGVDVGNIMQVSPEPSIRFLEDKTICDTCMIPGCPGAVRFEKDYFERGYIETNLPICPHAEYKEG